LTEHATHPLVASGPQARFLALLPLVAPDGFVVGTLTVLDSAPRRLRGEERREGGEPAARSAGAAQRSLAERLDDEVRRRREAEAALLREKEFSESVLDSLAGAFF